MILLENYAKKLDTPEQLVLQKTTCLEEKIYGDLVENNTEIRIIREKQNAVHLFIGSMRVSDFIDGITIAKRT
jgi:hypothetical protein